MGDTEVASPVVFEKDHELLAKVAQHAPHVAGSVLSLCNALEDADELPPPELLAAFRRHVEGLGRLIVCLANTPEPAETPC